MKRRTAPCFRCGVLVSLTESGRMGVHFAKVEHMFPCRESYRLARESSYPFAQVEMIASEMQSSELDLQWIS